MIRNLGANGSALAVTLVGQLALVPIFLTHWPQEVYADWLVLMTMPSILFVLNGGLGTIMGVQLSLLVTRGEIAEGALHFRRMLGATLVMGAGFIVVPWVPVLGNGLYWLIHPGTVGRGEFAALTATLGLYLGLGMVQSVVRALHRANEREYVGIGLQAGGRFFEYAAVAAAVLLGGGLADAIAVMTGAAIITTLVLAMHSQRLPQRITLLPRWPSWPVWRFFLVDGLPVVAVQAGTRCGQQGMLLLLNHLLDARAVLLVGTLQTVQRALNQAPMMLAWAHGPDMTTAYGRRDGRRLGRLVAMATVFSVSCGLAAGAAIVVLGPWLYGWWVRAAGLNPTRSYFVLLALDTILLGAWWPLSVMLNEIKRHRLWSWCYVLVVAISLGLAWQVAPVLRATTPFALSLLTGATMLVFILRKANGLLRHEFQLSLWKTFASLPWLARRRGPETGGAGGGGGLMPAPDGLGRQEPGSPDSFRMSVDTFAAISCWMASCVESSAVHPEASGSPGIVIPGDCAPRKPGERRGRA
ncbi:MAG TPA: hypothetical protein VHE13_16725 [Opitutus sp.]|nr:hypothetical protein [Opitutus sp.]